MSEPICPECAQGKHQNCTGETLDPDTDQVVDCGCIAIPADGASC